MFSSKIESLEASKTSLSLALASRAKEVDTLRAQLKKEKEKVFHLDEYSRRENLIFQTDIPEGPGENCRELIYDIMSKVMDVETSQVRCHAIHRMGKSTHGKPKSIIVRFGVQGGQRDCLSKKESLE